VNAELHYAKFVYTFKDEYDSPVNLEITFYRDNLTTFRLMQDYKPDVYIEYLARSVSARCLVESRHLFARRVGALAPANKPSAEELAKLMGALLIVCEGVV